jgi:hypothetical protein
MGGRIQFVEPPRPAEASVVDQEAQRRHIADEGHDAVHVRGLAKVGGEDLRLDPVGGAEFVTQTGQPRLAASDEDEVEPVGRQTAREGLTDATGGPRDDGAAFLCLTTRRHPRALSP